MSYQNQVSGLRANANGKTLERAIITSLLMYNREGVAFCDKTPEPVHQLSKMDRSGQFRAVYEKKAQPDFAGTWQGGWHVVFEAKNTNSKSIEKSRVTEAQACALDRCWDMGAICFVLVSFELKRFYRVPWNVWRNMEGLFGKKSVNERDLAMFSLEPYQKLNRPPVPLFDELDHRFYNPRGGSPIYGPLYMKLPPTGWLGSEIQKKLADLERARSEC